LMPPRSVHRNDQAYLTVGAAAKYLGTTTAKVSDTEVLELLDELGARSAPVATGVALEAAAERWSMGRSTFYKVRGRLVEAGLVTTGNNGVMRIPATAPTF